MMKKLSLVIAALAMVLGITQCKKQENPVGGKLITQEVTFTTSFGDGSKLNVTETEGTLDLKWQIGDKITVSDGQTEPSSTLECTSGGKTGTFKGTITCIEDAELTFTVGVEPTYKSQHYKTIGEVPIYLKGTSVFKKNGDYGEIPMKLPYAILKVDLSELAPESGSNDVSVYVNEIEDVDNPDAKVTEVTPSACKVYLLLPLTTAGQTTLTFTNGTKSITKTYTLASHGFYTGGGNGGYAPIMKDYLCFTAVEAGSSVSMKINGSLPDLAEALETSTDGKTWTAFTPGTTTITLANVGDKVYFRKAGEEAATSFSTGYYDYAYFVMTGKIAASGNVMSLIDPSCEAKEIPCDMCFYNLFRYCSSLTAAPTLPATSLKEACYCCMFLGCGSLTAAPELPATNLAVLCYSSMFLGCGSLTAAPNLPATNLADFCYQTMFKGCSKLTAAPELNATNLDDYCYIGMFQGCTSLTTAPELPATDLAEGCYSGMFEDCTSLTTAPALPATTLVETCYDGMFMGCSNLQDITVRFTQWDEFLNPTRSWVDDVPTGGTFHCPSGLSKTFGPDNIPNGWEVDATL